MAIQYTFTAAIRTAFSMLLATIVLPSPGFALPLEFTASYDLQKYGIVFAKSDYSLKNENNGTRITQHTEAVGFAALLSDDELDENSFLSLQNDQLLLTEFSHRQKSGDEKNRDIHLKIDWVQSDKKLLGKVSGTTYGKKLALNVDQPVWDTNSYLIPLMANTRDDAGPQQYTMMVKDRFKTYSFTTRGAEEIKVNGKTIKAIKVERDDRSGKDPIYLWLAPELNNLPVKIEKWKDGKVQITMSLNNAKFLSDKTLKFNQPVDNAEAFGKL